MGSGSAVGLGSVEGLGFAGGRGDSVGTAVAPGPQANATTDPPATKARRPRNARRDRPPFNNLSGRPVDRVGWLSFIVLLLRTDAGCRLRIVFQYLGNQMPCAGQVLLDFGFPGTGFRRAHPVEAKQIRQQWIEVPLQRFALSHLPDCRDAPSLCILKSWNANSPTLCYV